MKLTFILMFTGLLQLSASTFAQTITLKKNMASLQDIFSAIKQQSNYNVLYNSEMLKKAKPVTIDVKDASVKKVMDDCVAGQPFTYDIIDDNVIIKEKVNNIVPLIKDIQIVGRVTDAKGVPIHGVSVKIKGTTIATATDIEGIYHIKATSGNAILVFTAIGYTTKEIRVGEQTKIDISLAEDQKTLNDVVVIGYGTVKRKDFTGAVSSIKMENSPIALQPNMNALEALKGNVAGLNVGAVSSAGGQPSIQIRGQRSISGTNDPLILVDGVIFLGSISDINPGDIASYDILKDAVSAAAYGSRSANGIIAITTKKGKTGKPIISLRSETGIQKWQNRPVLLTGADWINVVNDRNKYAAGSTNWMQAGELANYKAGNETLWLDKVTQTGITHNNQVSVSGASPNVNYYMSSSYDDNKGIVVGDMYNHLNLLGKIDTKITSWLQLGLDGAYSRRDYSGNAANVGSAEIMSPYGVVYRDDAGNLEKFPFTQSLQNPLWGVNDGTIKNMDIYNSFRLNSFAVVKAPWIPGLSYRANFSANYERHESGNFFFENYYIKEGAGISGRYDPVSVQSLLSNANGNLDNTSTNSYILDNILTYDHSFGKHQINATAVATRDHLFVEDINATGSDFSANGNTALGIYGLSKATVQKVNLNNSERANVGYLARLNYSYDNKYYFTSSFRRDGASVFGAEKRYANFAAVGAAWLISSESFLKNFKPLNSLKLKFSWGQNGNQGLSPYATLSQVQNGAAGNARYEFSDAQGKITYGLVQTTLGNPNLGWEKTSAINIGFESAWLNNRLFVDVDYYSSKTTDQIFVRTIPVMTGFATQLASLGEVDNKGIEVNIRTENIKRPDFNWSSSFTFWKNSNVLKHLYGEDKNGDGKEDDDIANSFFIGKSLGAIYGYKQIGIVQTADADYIKSTGAAPGAPKYMDINADGKIDANDRTILGYSKENFRLSLSNTVRYKNLELYVMVSGIFGGNGYYLKSNTSAFMTSGTGRFNDNTIAKPYWTASNPSDTYPSAYFAGDGRFLGLMSQAFVRIQDVTLSYNIKTPLLTRANISNARLFLAARNLGTFTKWIGGDPETGTTVQSNTFPVASSYSLGINVSF
ncbi:TonB-dependent receptor [Pedobacter nutrimenti]|uniref:TonB-dependent receptor n=1 Tax=Pedobacter nutrimenti TaxID=1241337 RepID=UPI00292D92F1|nr:TonB-dependent receptor [Pedobacter nutrimenti]